jgi:hypothetical protein
MRLEDNMTKAEKKRALELIDRSPDEELSDVMSALSLNLMACIAEPRDMNWMFYAVGRKLNMIDWKSDVAALTV